MKKKVQTHQHQDLRVVQLESTHGYKYPSIDSGATPTGSVVRAPDSRHFQVYVKHKTQNSSTNQRHSDEDNILVPARSFASTSHSGDTDVGITFRVTNIFYLLWPSKGPMKITKAQDG
jgi:hypothetical protein